MGVRAAVAIAIEHGRRLCRDVPLCAAISRFIPPNPTYKLVLRTARIADGATQAVTVVRCPARVHAVAGRWHSCHHRPRGISPRRCGTREGRHGAQGHHHLCSDGLGGHRGKEPGGAGDADRDRAVRARCGEGGCCDRARSRPRSRIREGQHGARPLPRDRRPHPPERNGRRAEPHHRIRRPSQPRGRRSLRLRPGHHLHVPGTANCSCRRTAARDLQPRCGDHELGRRPRRQRHDQLAAPAPLHGRCHAGVGRRAGARSLRRGPRAACREPDREGPRRSRRASSSSASGSNGVHRRRRRRSPT